MQVRRWRIPVVVAVAMAAVVLVSLPFSGVAGPVVPGFSAGWFAVALLCDLITEGVPATFIPRLFERYSQGARAAGGAGIGLSVVHDLVQAHHGTIRYDLTDPAFIVTLPMGAPAEPRSEGRVLATPTRTHSTT